MKKSNKEKVFAMVVTLLDGEIVTVEELRHAIRSIVEIFINDGAIQFTCQLNTIWDYVEETYKSTFKVIGE